MWSELESNNSVKWVANEWWSSGETITHSDSDVSSGEVKSTLSDMWCPPIDTCEPNTSAVKRSKSANKKKNKAINKVEVKSIAIQCDRDDDTESIENIDPMDCRVLAKDLLGVGHDLECDARHVQRVHHQLECELRDKQKKLDGFETYEMFTIAANKMKRWCNVCLTQVEPIAGLTWFDCALCHRTYCTAACKYDDWHDGHREQHQ